MRYYSFFIDDPMFIDINKDREYRTLIVHMLYTKYS